MALITDSTGTNIADVNSSGRQLVQPPTDGANAGAVFLVGKPDLTSPSNTGSITGSSQGLLGVADVALDFDIGFTSLNTSLTGAVTSTMTVTVSGTSSAILNNNSTVTSGSYAILRTHRSFRADRGCDRIIGLRLKLEQPPVTDNRVEWGMGPVTTSTNMTAGAFFRLDSTGALRGVVIPNTGSEAVTSLLSTSGLQDCHDYVIVIGRNSVTFFVDELPVGSVDIPADSAVLVGGEAHWMFVRNHNTAATTVAQKVLVGRMVAATMGGSLKKSAAELAALRGDMGIQQVQGVGAGGSTAQWQNSVNPGAAPLSNTAPGYITMGGLFQFVALAGAATDYVLFAYQVPASSITNPGRTLLVRGVSIDAYVSVAAGTPTVATVLQWGIGVGSTAAALNTGETTPSKSPRRGFLGVQSVALAAVAGQELRRISQTFNQPLAVNNGEYLHIILRIPLGAATTYPNIMGGVFVDASWE